MAPPANAPSGPLMIGSPGRLEVPDRFALSLTVPPSVIAPEACVGMLGVTGFTVKHSFVGSGSSDGSGSLASGTPLVPDVNSPRKQYLPTWVTCATAERTGIVVVLLTAMPLASPICVPPLVQGT